jgi:CRISPR-associated Csx2 family protein
VRHALVTFLGRGREDPHAGYREASYRFPDGRQCRTNFFGLALAEYLQADRIIVLGTCGSMWGALVEHVAAAGEEEDARLALIDAEARGAVDQALLDRLTQVLGRATGREAMPRLIPFGRDEEEQREILQTIAAVVGQAEISFDLTHGFRHLGMIGMLSAFMLERVGRLGVRSLWYGALDMISTERIVPVLRLDGLNAIQRWVDALDRFDASGDYGAFAPLLEADGVPPDKARCLEEAAFHERTFNLGAAVQKLRTFRTVMASPLPGASGLFQDRLAERLRWIDEKDLAAQQRRLAELYLARADFVRAAVFAWEALVSRACRGHDTQQREVREAAEKDLDKKFRAKGCDKAQADAFRTLRSLRNALAHGTPPPNERCRRLLASPQRLCAALRGAVDALLA